MHSTALSACFPCGWWEPKHKVFSSYLKAGFNGWFQGCGSEGSTSPDVSSAASHFSPKLTIKNEQPNPKTLWIQTHYFGLGYLLFYAVSRSLA